MTSASPEPQGTTPSEQLLFRLCRDSFLQLWSYVNVYRDQGKKGEGDGKELCDVLVVFGDAVILFSDKSCEFPNTGNEEVDWGRWHRRAVEGSQRQLAGAERWIRQFPGRVFMDRRCTVPLHVTLPPPERMRVYKVAVALGAAERCRARYPGGSGSLPFVNPVAAGKDLGKQLELFLLPLLDSAGRIFHVVDDVTLPVMLHELDTIYDFVQYLDMKEKMIRSGQLLTVAGEEDLVGLFLGVRSGLPEIVSAMAGGLDAIHVAEGIYEDILSKPPYRQYTESNQTSYFWDELISRHSACTLDGTLVEGSAKTFVENESLLRVLASEPRVHRRVLADALLDLLKIAPKYEATSRTVDLAEETIYVLQVYPRLGRPDPEYRKQRQEYLEAYLILTSWRHQKKKRVVGVATDGGPPRKSGHDVMVLDVDPWTPERLAVGARLSREMSTDITRPIKRRDLPIHSLTPWKPKEDEPPPPKHPKNPFKRRVKRKSRRRK